MRYIHVSKACSDRVFKDIYDQSMIKPQQQDQKFHKMFVDGFKANQNQIDVISSRSINRENIKKIYFKGFIEKEDSLTYHYLPFLNFKLGRQFSLFFALFFKLMKLTIKKRKDVIVFCDILNSSLSFGVIVVTALLGVKRVAIVTDLAVYLDNGSQLFKKTTHHMTKRYHGYVLLSKYMNDSINQNSKPWMLLEGMTVVKKSSDESRYQKITFLYTGGLSKSSGIDTLLTSFNELSDEHIELQIAGHGELVDLVKSYSIKDPRIKYIGTLINNEVILLQKKVHFLINPRPSEEIQTKYAFPSKLIEYLSSGTPTISTNLLGIPDDYHPYLNFFEEESTTGFFNTFNQLLQTPYEILLEKAKEGQRYVFQNKNNVNQTKRVIEWTNQNFRNDKL